MSWTPTILRIAIPRYISTTPVLRRFQSITNEPLKIAFFGSDKFSVACLNKLYQLQQQKPSKIESIHVITRSIKPKGRGYRDVEDLPIGTFANNCDIPVLRADSAPEILSTLNDHQFSLAIAVSYGKLVPGAFIESCKYGGLNVHPSVLPKYSGSSPLQYALMNDDKVTGCTIQTLHPTKFDHGDIVLQKEGVPILDEDNFASLREKLGVIGGDLLSQAIDEGLYLRPAHLHENLDKSAFSLAKKIPPSKSQALWDHLLARQIKRLYDALGPLFTFIQVDTMKKRKHICEKQRVILSLISEANETDVQHIPELINPGDFTLGKLGLIIKAKDGYVSAGRVKMQTQKEESPELFMGSYHKKVGSSPKHFEEQNI